MSSVLHLLGFLWLPLLVYSALNDMVGLQKCTELLNTQKLVYCCGKSFLDKFLFVGSNCTPYWDDFGPCRYECLYRHWHLMNQENQINKPELYMMITSLYSPLNGYEKYGAAMKEAHETCEALGSRHADFLLLYSNQVSEMMGMASSTCLPYAMLHAQCTMVYLTASCPREYWMEDAMCNDLQKLLSSCTKKLDEKTNQLKAKDDGLTGNGCKPMDSKGHHLLLASLLTLMVSKLLSA
ncbi:uncharacterized protein LOC6530377 [Drosophila yakuba]|uniref:Odorant-binding protein 50b, isoform A n=2 Tax=Drosophila yakuba TaxID=7245 RepID=B4P750_DROYA|nr:uncharacterized protein LOC6530377 [Drosophila yakuba]EDW91015.1 Odorant-binding protein 50b, isoform A [Drosophila yakuba]